MKLTFKKNGGGYSTSCVISFGSEEARNLKLLDEKGNLKVIKSAINIDDDTIQINFEKVLDN